MMIIPTIAGGSMGKISASARMVERDVAGV
jgi:hypothetical protein